MSRPPTRPLGNGGPEVTRIGFGLMGLSSYYGNTLPVEEGLCVLDRAYELGERFWDTGKLATGKNRSMKLTGPRAADVYSGNEELVCEWFARNPEKRQEIFLATKFSLRTLPDGTTSRNSSPEYALRACDASLSRLGTSYIDLYYCHRLDGKTPVEETVGAMIQLKSAGKIKYLGLSECSAASLRRAHAIHPISAVQMEYSPFSLEVESPEYNILETCRDLGVALVAYSPLGRGMMSGALRSVEDFEDGDFRKTLPRFSAENFPKNLQLVDRICELATRRNVHPSQLTLAWLLAQGGDIFPIPGTTKIDRLKENVDSMFVGLSEDTVAQFRKAVEEANVHGDRSSETLSQMLFVDTPLQ
ncbi:NADP-dependent oxidoreductase domain-containing protein [Penicillium brevicompactum]|uniref:NADP-dependent oxidoreductase domain-containing protein n=1 Tax=Penicillium brevicompactum TaxID=5074 RepID=A0A9W9QMG8_PENBR|nr:NADP-dependent oxidoreductase domain-containing protein [Penicillium brevicompactum]